MTTSSETRPLDLLYPFYLDADMSMAFSAALAGGVALEAEQVDRTTDTSQAVKNLRGSLRLWRAGGVEAGRDQTTTADATSESRLSRRHTVASIFIDLYDELRQSGRLIENPTVDGVQVGDIVSMRLDPAVAPLRRVVDQVLRLLDVMGPMADLGSEDAIQGQQGLSRQQRRAQARDAAKRVQPQDDAPEDHGLAQLRSMFVALRDDLEHSGMIDIAVTREDGPSAVLTLDKRFVAPPTLELLHTSSFTVVGKVTQIWTESDDVVNLFRRSVLSLVPRLAQATVWGVFAFLVSLSRSLDVEAIEKSAMDAVAGVDDDEKATPPDLSLGASGQGEDVSALEEEGPDPDDDADSGDVMIGDDVSALNPIVNGPALQILPLAICS